MTDTRDRTDDDARIRALFGDLMQAWTDNDAEAYAGYFTDDSDYVSYDGTRAVGRAQHQHNHDKLFRGVLAGSALVGVGTDAMALAAARAQAVAPDTGAGTHVRRLAGNRDSQRPGPPGHDPRTGCLSGRDVAPHCPPRAHARTPIAQARSVIGTRETEPSRPRATPPLPTRSGEMRWKSGQLVDEG
jgi:uncharacterized protein (TIGR02246 family)